MAVEIESLSPTDRRDWDEFTRFMLENSFPFHVNPSPTREEIESRKADGGFAPPEYALLAVRVGGGLVGVVGLEDLDGNAPLFDIHLADGMRGKDWGKKTVRELVRHLFDTYSRITRIEAQTRNDNIAMRRVLLHPGIPPTLPWFACLTVMRLRCSASIRPQGKQSRREGKQTTRRQADDRKTGVPVGKTGGRREGQQMTERLANDRKTSE